MDQAQDTAGLVLAAGSGSRYGYPKILAPGFLDAALTALQGAGLTRISVVTGATRVKLPKGIDEVFCPSWDRGMGASLRAGLQSASGQGKRVLVHVVDCPDINARVVTRVLSQDHTLPARAVFEGRPGHPVVLPQRYVAELLSVLDDEAGAGRFLKGLPDLQRIECSDLASGHDIDFQATAVPDFATGIGNPYSRP
ncbi:nucleotidyltransferase family protein [Arthrobacter crystallopoietes]|uniref:nucleotidyltransferase family protein n=1 Tax=Crystallibacter crystallopoietes TaxID=37928 RepID=UPI0014868E8C|nr:nucleotidyltransferase family protein [Arthrobacter crystallopoietes]